MTRATRRLVCSLALAAGLSASAVAETAPTECDRLAASPVDPDRLAPPVEFDDMDGAAAEVACRAALAGAPGTPRLVFQLGRALDRQDRIDEARAVYQQAIDAGSLPAMLALGKLIELGLGSPVDYAAAAALYRTALDRGLKFAAGDLAYLHQEGQGFAEDKTEAARLYAIAVEAGDAWAKVNLGFLLENGNGVAKDVARATDLYRQAAEQGNAIGQYNIGLMYAVGNGVPKDDAVALRWLKLSADQEYAPAYLALGRQHLHADPATRDEEEAERNFLLAFLSGEDDSSWRAANELAWMWATTGERLEEAAEMIAGAMERAPADDAERPGVIDTAAWVAHRQGRNEDALGLIRQAIALKPNHAPYHDRLGDIYAALGRAAEARAEWQAAVDMVPPAEALDPDWDRDAVLAKLKGQ
ncbi:MAG: tetratricopeptide repeat protein [Bauldia sp.]|nr:MAG: tetratricopeptide repeat protein [Bauldia sp.]